MTTEESKTENKNTLDPPSEPSEGTLIDPPAKNWKNRFRDQFHEKFNGAALKERLGNLKQQVAEKLNKESLKQAIQNFDAQTAIERVSKAVQQKDAGFYGTLATIVLSTYFVSDLSSLLISGFIPEPTSTRSNRFGGDYNRSKTFSDYNAIYSRNLFNSQGLIPGEDTGSGLPSADLSGPPRKNYPSLESDRNHYYERRTALGCND